MLSDEQQAISVPLSIMGNSPLTATNFPGIAKSVIVANPGKSKGCIVVQTCDAYKPYWDSFLWSFNKYWDKKIDWPLFFCNEEIKPDFVNPLTTQHIATGMGSHSTRLAKILDALVEYEYVFYMLEDFWLTDRMTHEMFSELFQMIQSNNWDSLRVAPYMPAYYKMEPTEFAVQGRKILKFTKESEWQFSQQASFWKRDFLRKCVVEAQVSDIEVSSSIAGEIAMDKYLRQTYPDSEHYLYHYHWYPISGSVWRGKLTQMGEQIEFLRQVDMIYEQQFGQTQQKNIFS